MKSRLSFTNKAILVAVILITGTAVTANATAEMINISYDGYVAMGGMVCNTTNSYLLPGYPESPPQGTFETFGYAFLKCDSASLPVDIVDQALLELDVIALQDGMTWPAEGTATLTAFATTADVTTITSSTAGEFVDCISDVGSDPLLVTGAGQISLDVTSIVNEWITSGNNYGLVLATPEGLIPRLHSAETTTGAAPMIAVVPEPTAMGLLVAGSLVLLSRRNRRIVNR